MKGKRFFKIERNRHDEFNDSLYAVYHPDGHIICCMSVDHRNKDVDFVIHDYRFSKVDHKRINKH